MTGAQQQTRRALRRRAARRRTVRIGTGVAAAVALVTGGLAGAQALAAPTFQDRATVESTVGAGLFEIALLDEGGRIRSLAREGTTSVKFTPAEHVVPGSTVRVPVTVANNGPFAVAPTISVEVTSTDIPNIENLVRVTVTERNSCLAESDAESRTLIGDPGDAAKGVPLTAPEPIAGTTLPGRDGKRQGVGAFFAGGDPACHAYSLSLHLTEDASLRTLSAGTWTVNATIEGRSAE